MSLIARFYQLRARRRTFYGLFIVCALGLMIGGAWDAFSCGTSPDWPPAAILSAAGVLLVLAAEHLFGLMLGGPT